MREPVLFRAEPSDGTDDSPLGRCLAVARALRALERPPLLATAHADADAIAPWRHLGRVYAVSGPAGGRDDVRSCLAIAAHLDIRWIVVAGAPGNDRRFQRLLREGRMKVLALDTEDVDVDAVVKTLTAE